ncbi:hypothetical protein FOA52_001957 [Chlamydomonas sp. UWO 241]|nr:hypothetical protein FOA52_001957 [Chlamydomonas sp. UWO 241]
MRENSTLKKKEIGGGGLDLVAAREAAFTARQAWFEGSAPLRTATVRSQLFFPDRKLLQYDCGKLQEMAGLLRRLKSGGHRCLIFTQMSKMLDLLEAFLNLHGHTYMRLDGSTKPEQRQILMQRFNTDPKVFCFILSTRSGGVGINLIGADTVIFYDSDWNPAMDAQAQDRCHRIGQTREVHIYRLVSDNTIEENILAKSDQKRQLDWLAIQSAGFTTDMLSKFNVRDFFGNATAGSIESGPSAEEVRAAMRGAEDEDDAHAAIELEKEQEQEDEEFTTEVPAGAKEDGGEEAGEAGDEDDEDGNAQDATQDADGKPKGAKKGAAAAAAATGAAGKSVSRSRSPGGGAGGDDEPDGGQPAEDEDDGGGGALVAAAAAGGGDILANIDAKLKPIEKYAVRLLEEWYPEDFDAAAAVIDKGLDENAWDVDEMARRKEEQEEECEDSEGDELVEEWDKATATEAYREYATMIKEQIQQAEAEMEKYMAAEAEAAARATAAAAAAAQQAASGWDDVYVGGAGGGRVKAEPGEPGSSGVGGIMMVKPEEDVYYLGTRRPPGLASHAFTQSHESDAGRPRAEALCGSWLGQQAAVRPAVGAQRLLLPWPTSWDAALCGAVLKAVAKLAQQVPLSEVAWHSVAEAVASDAVSSALSGAAQQRGGNSQKHPPMLALAMATPERCAARYTQLHVALLAAHGILPPNALVGSVTERLAAVLYSLPPTEREAAIARMRLPAADAKGSKFADGLADGGGSAPPRGVGDLADRMGEQLGAVLALVAAREGAGHGAPPPPRALDLAQLGVSAFDAEQLVAAVAEVDARRAQAAASARSQQAAAARGVQRTQLDSSTQALRSTSGGAGGGAGSSGGSGGGGGGGGGGGFKIKIGGVHLGVVGGAGATPLSTPLTGASSGSAGGGGKPPLSSGGAKGGGKAKCAGGGSQGSQPGQPRTASLNDAGADALSAHQQYAAGTPPAMPGDGGLGLGLRLGLGTPPHGLWGASAPNGGGGGAGPSPLGLGGASGEDAEPTPPPLMSAAAAEWQQQQQQMMMMQAQYGGLGGFGAPSGSGQYGGMGMGGMPAYPGMMPGQGPDAMQQHMAAMHMQQMQMQHMHMHMAPMQQAQHASLGGFGQPSQQHMALGGFGAPAPMQQQQVSLGGFGAPAPAPLGGFGVPPPQQQQQQHQLGGFGPPGPNNNLGFG